MGFHFVDASEKVSMMGREQALERSRLVEREGLIYGSGMVGQEAVISRGVF